MATVSTILLPTRPQPDTIVAIFLLKKFGQERFNGIVDASVQTQPTLLQNENFDTLLARGVLALDLGGGMLDHHGKNKCTSELVAAHLEVEKDPSVTQLLTYAKRDDKEGKGTVSRDALDRAFGLSGLIAALNKAYPQEPQYVVEAILPLLEAHWRSAQEHHVELPRDIERKRETGEYVEESVEQKDKTLKFVSVISDKPSMPTYLRSERGGRADVVLQKAESTNHLCVVSRQDRGIDLSKVAGLIRLREAELGGIELPDDESYLAQTGRISEIDYWYFDPATNSLLNGGPHSPHVPQSRISWEEIKKIVAAGLGLGASQPERARQTQKGAASYYISVNIPEDAGQRIVSRIEASSGVKVHSSKNLHVTLHHLGQKSSAEAAAISQKIAQALTKHSAFDLTLHDGQLASGSPEGYTYTTAWYLAVGKEDSSHIDSLRASILSALDIPVYKKEFHVTIAANRDHAKRDVGGVVRFAEPVEMTVPVAEVVLMENVQVQGKRLYRPHTVFPLAS